jgi:5-aminolevulinate synthase
MPYSRFFDDAISKLKGNAATGSSLTSSGTQSFPRPCGTRPDRIGEVVICVPTISLHGPASAGDRSDDLGRGPAWGRGRRHTQYFATNHPLVELEAELAGLHGKEAALVFTSGWISNLAISMIGDLVRLPHPFG